MLPYEGQEEEQRQEQERLQELDDIKLLLKQPEGIRFFKRLLERCHVFRTSFTGNSFTFFNEGERNIGLFLMNEINEACPDKSTIFMS
jgi:hypothetical protein